MSDLGRVMNLTQHSATSEQVQDGVFDLDPDDRKELQVLLTFEEILSAYDLELRAAQIVHLAQRVAREQGPDPIHRVMLGGAPFFMHALHEGMKDGGFRPTYAFSARESVETVVEGKVVKTSVFAHKGLIA